MCVSCVWKGVRVCALIDSGATHSLVTLKTVRALGLTTKRGTRMYDIVLPNGSRYPGCDFVVCALKTDEGYVIRMKLLIVDLPIHDIPIILGIDWLTGANPAIDWHNRTLCFGGCVIKAEDPAETNSYVDTEADTVVDLPVISYLQAAKAIEHGAQVFMLYTKPLGDTTIEGFNDLKGDNEEINNMLDEYSDVFGEPTGMPPERPMDFHIDLVPGAKPPHRAPYRLGPVELAELRKQLDVLLAKGLIQPSCSEFAAPVFLIKKKDGSFRLICDWRLLNAITVKSRTPLARIEDLLDALLGARYFSTFDMASGYWQLRIHPPDTHKTAFVTRYGQFEWRVCSFGMCNCPSAFTTLMNHVFQEYLDKFIVIYIDDICVFSKSLQDHIVHLKLTLQKLRDHQLYCKAKKCRINQPQVTYLGHIVSGEGVQLDPAKVQAIAEWPVPSNSHHIKQFLGLCGWFRRFIKGFSRIAAPLHDLTAADVPFEWSQEQQMAFEALKAAVTHAPVLSIFDPKAETRLHTDASGRAIGGVLLQRPQSSTQCEWHPVAFFSRKLNPAECNYAVHERELLAVVECVKNWAHYLHTIPVVVQVDHEALKWFWAQPKLSPRQARWVTVLQSFDLHIEYQRGKLNVVADALSRRPDYDTGEPPLVLLSLSTSVAFSPLAAELHQAALDDSCYQTMLRAVQDGLLPHHECQDGLVYERKGDRVRLVVPSSVSLRNTLMYEAHDAPPAGHRGFAKTLFRLCTQYTWKGISGDVKRYVQACATCAVHKDSTQHRIGKLRPLPVPAQKWSDITMDFIVALPTTKDGFDSCMVVTDRLTKMVVCIPTKSTATAPQVADAFIRHVFRHFGLPEAIVSDRDVKFTSQFWRSLFKLLGTKLCFSSAYHPQTDGATERANKSLEHVLRCFVAATQPKAWANRLPLVEFALNSAVHASTGYSPFYLMYGFQPRDPLALLHQLQAPVAVEPTQVLLQQLKEDLAAAQRAIAASQYLQAKYADRTRRHVSFHVGDSVFLSTQNLAYYKSHCKKLRARWCGPFPIAEIVSPVAVRLELPASIPLHPVVHTEWLKLAPAPLQHSPAFELPPLTSVSDDEDELIPVSQVHQVLDKRFRNGHVYYLIRWSDMPAWDVTWHTRTQILAVDSTADSLLDRFDSLTVTRVDPSP